MKKFILTILAVLLWAGMACGESTKRYIVPGLETDITDGSYNPGNSQTGNAYGNMDTARLAASSGDFIIFRSGLHEVPSQIQTVAKTLYYSLYSEDVAKAYIPGIASGSTMYFQAAGDGSTWGPGLVLFGGGNGGNASAFEINANEANFVIYPEVENWNGRPVYIISAGNDLQFHNAKFYKVTNGVYCNGGASKWHSPVFEYVCNISNYNTFKVGSGTHTIYHGVILGGDPLDACMLASGGVLNVYNSIVAHGKNGVNTVTWKQTGVGALNVSYTNHNTGIYNVHSVNTSGTVSIENSFLNVNPKFTHGRPAIITFFMQDSNHASGAWAASSLKKYADFAQNHNIDISYFPDDSYAFSENMITNINNYMSMGLELGVTGSSSSRLDYLAPIQIASTRTNPQVIVSTDDNGSCEIILRATGDSDIIVPDTDKSSTVGGNRFIGTATAGLLKFINDQTGWSASLTDAISFDDAYAYCLASGTYNITGTLQDILWDMPRWLTEEILNSKTYMINALNAADTDITSYFFSREKFNSSAKSILQDANFQTAFCTGTTVGQTLEYVDLLGVKNIKTTVAAIRGSGYDALSDAQKEARIRTWAENFAYIGRVYGIWIAIELFNIDLDYYDDTNTLSVEELHWFTDSFQKRGGLILSVKQATNIIKGLGVNAGNDIYTINFNQANNKIKNSSVCYRSAIAIEGVNDAGTLDPYRNVFKESYRNIGAWQGKLNRGILEIGGSAAGLTGGSKSLTIGGRLGF